MPPSPFDGPIVKKPVGQLYRQLNNIRPVGTEAPVTEYFVIPPGGPLSGVLYRLTELPLNSPILTQPQNAAIECIVVDPITHLPAPTPVQLTALIQTGPTPPTLVPGSFIIKMSSSDIDDTFKYGQIRFSSADAGLCIQINYTGRGSLVWADDVLNLNSGLSLLSGTILPGHISLDPTDDFYFPRDVYVDGDIHLTGELSKEVTTIITTTDTFLRLNDELANNVAPTEDAGITVNRGNQPDAALTWSESPFTGWTFTGGPLAIPGIGSDTAVIFNENGALSGNAASFSWDRNNNILNVGGTSPISLMGSKGFQSSSDGGNALFLGTTSATNGGTIFAGARCGGTLLSPTPTVSGDDIAILGAIGYANGAFDTTSPGGELKLASLETWSGAAHGTGLILNLTASGTVGHTTVLTATADGGGLLDLYGKVKIRGGAPGAGKVLTSDANGLATWEAPAGGGLIGRVDIVATASQTDFVLPGAGTYNPGTGDLEVYRNGVLMTANTVTYPTPGDYDYYELNNTTIRFNTPRTAGEVISLVLFGTSGGGGGGGGGGNVTTYNFLFPVQGPNNFSSYSVDVDNSGNATADWGGQIAVTGTYIGGTWTIVLTGTGPLIGESGTLTASTYDGSLNATTGTWTFSTVPTSGSVLIQQNTNSFGGPHGTSPFNKRAAVWVKPGLLGYSDNLTWDEANGRLGINTPAPTTSLHVDGDVRIDDGTAASGYVLTASDSTGLSSWQALPSLPASDSANTPSTLVLRDANGDFLAGAITGKQFTDTIQGPTNLGATPSVDWSLGGVIFGTMTASWSSPIAFSNQAAGQTLTLFLTQGGTGSYTASWPTMKWPSGNAPTLSTSVGATDVITIFYDGSDYWGFVGGQNY